MDFATNEVTFAKNREIFMNFYMLCAILNDFEIENNQKNTQKLIDFVTNIGPLMPLPSGSFGNALAVALEMHFFSSALFIIKHPEIFKIDLNFIANKLNNRDYVFFSALEEFKISQIGFNKEQTNEYHSQQIATLKEIEIILNDGFKENIRKM